MVLSNTFTTSKTNIKRKRKFYGAQSATERRQRQKEHMIAMRQRYETEMEAQKKKNSPMNFPLMEIRFNDSVNNVSRKPVNKKQVTPSPPKLLATATCTTSAATMTAKNSAVRDVKNAKISKKTKKNLNIHKSSVSKSVGENLKGRRQSRFKSRRRLCLQKQKPQPPTEEHGSEDTEPSLLSEDFSRSSKSWMDKDLSDEEDDENEKKRKSSQVFMRMPSLEIMQSQYCSTFPSMMKKKKNSQQKQRSDKTKVTSPKKTKTLEGIEEQSNDSNNNIIVEIDANNQSDNGSSASYASFYCLGQKSQSQSQGLSQKDRTNQQEIKGEVNDEIESVSTSFFSQNSEEEFLLSLKNTYLSSKKKQSYQITNQYYSKTPTKQRTIEEILDDDSTVCSYDEEDDISSTNSSRSKTRNNNSDFQFQIEEDTIVCSDDEESEKELGQMHDMCLTQRSSNSSDF